MLDDTFLPVPSSTRELQDLFTFFFLSFCLDRLSFVLIHKDTPAQTEGKKKMKAQKAERVFIFNM